MLIWRLAYRNLFRHKTRLVLNLFLLVGAFSAIVVFKGFSAHVLGMMKKTIVETQFAHLDIAKKSFWDNSAVDRKADKMIEAPAALAAKIAKLPEVAFASERTSFYGLVNTESKSYPGKLIGFDPTNETKLQSNLLFTEGGPFTERKTTIVGIGLSKLLKVKPGDDVTIVSPTLDGGINAMDLKVVGIFSTGFSDVDNGTIFLPLADAKKVLDTERADQVLIGLKDESTLASVISKVTELAGSPDLQVKSWSDLAELYMQVEVFYKFENAIIEIIMLSLLILSVSNTTNMAIFERLGEIGTLRALGDYEFDIQKLFFLEAVFMGALSVLIGIPVAYLLSQAIASLGIPVIMPFTSRPIILKMVSMPSAYVEASLVCFFSILIASLWPSYKGSRSSIVVALRAKI